MTDDSQSTTRQRWLTPEGRPLSVMLATRLLASISNSLTGVAVPWFVLATTGSPTKTGITAAVTMLPAVIMTVLGGAFADRWNPKVLSVGSDVLSGVTVALVPLLYAFDLLNFPLLLLLMFLGAVFDGPGYTARDKMLPQLADQAGIPLEHVNSMTGMTFAISGLVGTLAAGFLIAIVGATNVLWINAAAFAVSAGALWSVLPNLHVPREDAASMWDDIREGYTYLRHHNVLGPFVICALFLNMLLTPVVAVMLPVLAKLEWESSAQFGIALSGFGAGALVGAFAFGIVGTRLSKRAVVSLGGALFSLPVYLMVDTPGVVTTWVALFLIGIGSGLVNPTFSTIVMRTTPRDKLGRVSGVLGAGSMVASPLGIFLAAPIVENVGLSETFLMIAVALTALCLVMVSMPAMRRIDSMGEEPTPEST